MVRKEGGRSPGIHVSCRLRCMAALHVQQHMVHPAWSSTRHHPAQPGAPAGASSAAPVGFPCRSRWTERKLSALQRYDMQLHNLIVTGCIEICPGQYQTQSCRIGTVGHDPTAKSRKAEGRDTSFIHDFLDCDAVDHGDGRADGHRPEWYRRSNSKRPGSCDASRRQSETERGL